jgi:hypothetical protein
MSIWPALPVLLHFEDGPVWLKQGGSFAVFALTYALFVWGLYFFPRSDYLILHEEGFQVKIGFKHRRFRFDQVRSITFGLKGPMVKGLQAMLAWFNAGKPSLTSLALLSAINLHFKSGREGIVRQFLLRFEPDDTEKFFQWIADRHPELLQEAHESLQGWPT